MSIIFNGDLSPGNLSQYPVNQMAAKDRATVYDANSQPTWPKPKRGKYACRFHVLNGDVAPLTPTNNPRAQVASGRCLPEGLELWWEMSIFFPSSFPNFDSGWFLWQEDYGAPWNGSPPIGLGVAKGQIIISRSPYYNWDWVWATPLVRNRWITFLTHKKMSRSASGGFVEMWMDGVQQRFSPRPYGRPAPDAGVTRLTMQTMHADATGAYQFFINSYRASGSVNAAVDTFYDGMKVATTRAEVETGTSSAPAPSDPATAPVAAFTWSPAKPVVGSPVTFDASTSKNAASYAWSLDGRTQLSGVKPSFTFKGQGTKKVTLTVTSANGQKASVTQNVVVGAAPAADAPTADFVYSPSAPRAGQVVQFDASGSKNAASYAWDLDGVSQMTGVKPTFTFKNPGSKKVTLTVTGTNGQKAPPVTRTVVVS